MVDVVKLMYSTTNTPLIILILAGLVFIVIAIIYVIYNQSKTINSVKQEDVNEEDITYNIYKEEVQEVVESEVISEPVPEVPTPKKEFDFEGVVKKLEAAPKSQTVVLTPYELEQEENAIISYDELVTRQIPVLEISKALKEEVMLDYDLKDKIDQVQYNEKVDKVVKEEVQSTTVSSNKYDHEESFLDSLKNLKDSLN